jgi:hypothetical protein
LQRKDKISSNGPPSLLTPAQQAEAERNRILSTLEASGGKRSPTSSPNARHGSRAPWIWAFSGLLVAAVAGGAGLWYGQQREPSTPLIVAAATPEAVAQTDVAANGAVTPAAAEPATAIIEEDHQARSAPLPDAQPSLSEMLAAEPPAPPAAGATGDVLSQALEAPAGSALAAAAAAPVAAKVAARGAERASAPAKPKPPVKRVAAVKPAPKAVPKQAPKPAPAPDRDVMLLSALIAHAQASEPAPQARTRASLDQELAYCKKQPKAELAACRKRACDGRATAAACKVKR